MSFRDAVAAVRGGEVERLAALLRDNADLVHERLADNPRTLLHYATDWPGHYPRVGESIGVIAARGADLDAGAPFDTPGVAETPLHWAASSNDVVAVRALLDAGASVDVLGGIFGGCTPFEEAIIFEKYEAARVLLDHGATNYLPGAAALGMADAIDSFFDTDGRVDVAGHALPHWTPLPPAQVVLDRAFQFACRAGHVGIAQTLLARGAAVNAITPADTTALDEAAENGHDDVVRWLTALGGRPAHTA